MKKFLALFDLHFGFETGQVNGNKVVRPTHNLKAIGAVKKFAEDFKPDILILGGDQLNCGPISHWHHGKPRLDEGLRLKEEYNLLRDNILEPFKSTERKIWLTGNHECQDLETEIMSPRGWLKAADVNIGDLIYTVNPITEQVELKPITNIVFKPYTGNLIRYNTKVIDQAITPGHRFYGRKYSEFKKPSYFIEASKIFGERVVIPCAAKGYAGNGVYYTDDEIRIAAWLITDSHIHPKYKYITFYQREEKKHLITDILDRLCVEYKEVNRGTRNTSVICGKKLKTVSNGFEIRLNKINSEKLLSLVSNKANIPNWVQGLNQRQLKLFVDAWVDADGSRAKDTLMIYCSRPVVKEQLQIILTLAGYHSSQTEYRPGHFRINISHSLETHVTENNQKYEFYDDYVWCVSTENGTLITRRNTKVSITGNCWIEDYVNQHPGVEGLLEPKENLKLIEDGWEYYSQGAIVKIGKLHFTHGDTLLGKSNYTNPAQYLVSQTRVNIRCGHLHTYYAAPDINPINGKDQHTGIIVPGLCNTNPFYTKNKPNKFMTGFLYGYILPNGNFQDFVVIITNNQFIVNGVKYE